MHLRIAAAFLFIVSFALNSAEFEVTTTALFSEEMTLPRAVDLANASADASVRITFKIPGAGPHKIEVDRTLVIARNMVIDGTTQPGYAGTPLIQISRIEAAGSVAQVAAVIPPQSASTSVFEVNDTLPPTSEVSSRAVGFGVTFKGLSITDAAQYGIWFRTGDAHVVEACYIGVAPDGSAAGNDDGIRASFQVAGLRIGTDGNGDGDAAEGNVIGNNDLGIYMESSSSKFRIAGNRIGLLPSGAAAANRSIGIQGVVASEISVLNNIIANNGDCGIYLTSGCDDVVIQGNRIVGNGFSQEVKGFGRAGIYLSDSETTLVGTNGDGIGDVAERNIISGNGLRGIYVTSNFQLRVAEGDPTQVRIAGNYIGVDSDGSALGNGTFVQSAMSRLVDDAGGAGVEVQGSLYVVIGSDKNGSAGEANEGNVISSNTGSGIEIEGSQQLQAAASRGVAQQILLNPYNVRIAANTIGAAPNKVTARANTLDGIGVDSATVEVGGTETGAGNLIANNGRNGVSVVGQPALVTILGNSITANVALGIDLGNNGVTPNDANQVFPPEGSFPGSVTGDPDFGPNGLSNTPVITSISADRKTVTGTLNSSVNESSILRAVEGEEPVPATSMYRIEFFSNPDASPNQGQRFLGSTDVTISDLTTCTAAFTATLTTPPAPGTTVTATATRLHEQLPETSEFSVPNAASRVPALLFLSGPSFTPPTPTTDDVVTFTASASIVGITITWDFGDGSATAQGETVTHQYAAPGEYSVTVTLLDAPTGLVITKTLLVPVVAGATPQPPSKPAVSDFRVRTLNVSLDTNPNRDFIAINGLVSLPKGFVLTGTTLDLNVGGVLRSFTFNKKGKARAGSDSAKFSKPKGTRNQDFTVAILLKKGTFAEILKTNATNKDANGLPSAIVVRARFNGKDFVRVVPVKFKSKGTKTSTKFGVF